VGDDDVEPAELLDTGVDGRLQGVEIPDVDLGGVDPAVEAFHQVGGLGQILRAGQRNLHAVDLSADVDRDDVGALLGHPHRVGAALAPGGPGDECDLAFESSCHVILDSVIGCGGSREWLPASSPSPARSTWGRVRPWTCRPPTPGTG